MRIFILAFLFLNTYLSVARQDSLKLKSFHGIYFNLYYPTKYKGNYENHSKYSNEYYYQFEILKYNSQTPAVGIGYMLNYKGLFLKADINYWRGTKDIDYSDRFNSENKNSKNYYDSFTASSQFSQYPSLGYRYYRLNDHYTAKLNIHYLDFSMAFSGNITRFLRLYSGFRYNVALNYNFDGKIDRQASLYEVKGYISQYQRIDSLVSTENIIYQNSDMKKMSIQAISNNFFYNLGVNFNFRIKNQVFFVDACYETNKLFIEQEGPIANGYSIKLGYLLYYSKKLGD